MCSFCSLSNLLVLEFADISREEEKVFADLAQTTLSFQHTKQFSSSSSSCTTHVSKVKRKIRRTILIHSLASSKNTSKMTKTTKQGLRSTKVTFPRF